MRKSDVVRTLLQQAILEKPLHEKGLAFAPTNIALCKYWGKRDVELNLPMTSSLSIALPDKGAMTTLYLHDAMQDVVVLNQTILHHDTEFVKRIVQFLDLFRPKRHWFLRIEIQTNIPIAAGLASSASGFASLILALNDLFGWQLSMRTMSILARLGSGSASRSLWNGFVEWHAGVQPDGMDSFAEPVAIDIDWPELRLGILTLDANQKMISSREAMQRTVTSSVLYASWPKKVSQDLAILKQALQMKNFSLLGGTAESNALTMHATMLSSWPPICYFKSETIAAMHDIWKLRQQGLEIYFTQDAGPNLKLLFQEKDADKIKNQFPDIEMIQVFEK